MNLADVVAQLDEANDTQCIVAKKPWSASSESMLIRLDKNHRVPAEALDRGLSYFLEVGIALDEVLSGWPSLPLEQRIKLLIFYAENDAFPEWVYQC